MCAWAVCACAWAVCACAWAHLVRPCPHPCVCLLCRYGGFREARVHAHKGVGFVEFDSEAAATIAMQALANFRLSETHILQLSYAKK
jgi:hypothetical protein